MWIFGPSPTAPGRLPAKTSALSSNETTLATSARGSIAPELKSAIAPATPGDALNIPIALRSFKTGYATIDHAWSPCNTNEYNGTSWL
jgi:hypothetical protein